MTGKGTRWPRAARPWLWRGPLIAAALLALGWGSGVLPRALEAGQHLRDLRAAGLAAAHLPMSLVDRPAQGPLTGEAAGRGFVLAVGNGEGGIALRAIVISGRVTGGGRHPGGAAGGAI